MILGGCRINIDLPFSAHDDRGVPSDDAIRRKFPEHHAPCTDDRSGADFDAFKENRAGTDKDIIPNANRGASDV